MFVHMSAHAHIHMSMHMSANMSVHMPAPVSAHMFAHIAAHMPVCMHDTFAISHTRTHSGHTYLPAHVSSCLSRSRRMPGCLYTH